MTVIVFSVGMVLLFFVGFPIHVAMLLVTIGYFILNDLNPIILVSRFLSTFDASPLLAIPYFILAGVLMNHVGITKNLLQLSQLLVRRLPGGLAQVNVVLSGLMGGLSGSNLADAAMQAKILVPHMNRASYPLGFSTALTATTSLITPIIPPGITLIVFAYLANESVGKMFVAAIGPGVLLAALLMGLVHTLSKRRSYPYMEPDDQDAGLGQVLLNSLPAVMLPVIVVGGIRFGIFTPTEAGAMAVVYAVLLGILNKKLKIAALIASVHEAVGACVSVMILFGSAAMFSYVLNVENVDDQISLLVSSFMSGPVAFLIAMSILLIIMGMFMDGGALLLISVPLFLPSATALGIEPVHFGIVLIVNISLGLLTPPVGTLMFLTCHITSCDVREFIRAMIPFYIGLVLYLLLLINVPSIVTFLPEMWR